MFVHFNVMFNLTQWTKEPYMQPWQIRIKKLSSHGMFDLTEEPHKLPPSQIRIKKLPFHAIFADWPSFLLKNHYRISLHFQESATVLWCTLPRLAWIWLYSTHRICMFGGYRRQHASKQESQRFLNWCTTLLSFVLIPTQKSIWM